MSKSYALGSPQQTRNLNDSRITTTSILSPQITSTPCISPSKTRTASSLVTPRRFLGPRRYALSSNGMLSPRKAIKNPPGPLLTSTSFNVNVSTYIDSKSPGYTGRLIQYNEESSRNQLQTHQEKYGSPGLFPIVHLFKKDLPVITPKPKQVTVRVGTPEFKNQYSQEHNRLLLEGIVRNNSVIKENSQSTNEVSTRSVLDALKEISRKRIHATEEYEIMDETNKKLRRDCINGDGDCSKRNRVDSPTSEASTSPQAKQATKKLCTIDAILASKTSSMYANFDAGNKRKPVEDSKTKLSPVNKKKFQNAETQTLSSNSTPVEPKKHSVETSTGPLNQIKSVEKSNDNSIILEETTSPPKQVLKIFDDKPLEIIRKNRLGALLSALTGHEIPPIPMEDRKKALDQDWPPQKADKLLVSILSSPDKQRKTFEKHVTFNIPESVSENRSTNENSTEKLNTETPLSSKIPEICDSINETKSLDDTSNNQTSSLNINEKLVNNSSTGDTPTNTSSIGGFKFDATKSTAAEKNLAPVGGFKFDLAKAASPVKDVIDKNISIGSFQLNPATTIALVTTGSKIEIPKMSFSSPNVPISSSIASASLFPKFGISSSEIINSSQLPLKSSLEANITKSVSSSMKTNSLGLPSALPPTVTQSSFGKGSPKASFSFGTSEPAPSSSASSSFVKSDLTFDKSEASSKPSSSFVSNLSMTTITPSPAVNKLVSPNDVNSTTAFTTSKTVYSNLSPYSAPVPVSNITTNNTICNSNALPLTSTPTHYGNVSSSVTPAFGLSINSPTFGIPSSKNVTATTTSQGVTQSFVPNSTSNFISDMSRSNAFSFTSANSLPAFGTKSTTTSGFGATPCVAPTNAFDNASLNFGDLQANTSFGTTKTTASFGLGSNTKVTFGNPASTQSMFAVTTTPSFGTNANNSGTDSKAFVFGSGNTQNFGQPSTSVPTSTVLTLKNSQSGMTLGTNTSASTASNIQSGSTAPAFGTAGNMFPSAVSNTYGQSTSVSSFSTTSAPTLESTTIPPFGTTAAPTFGTTNTVVFGANSAPAFGNNGTPAFRITSAPTFSTSSPPFGSTSVPTFGTTNVPTFGTTSGPVFGSASAPLFGATNATSFETTSTSSFITTPAFGITTTTPTFGTSNSLNFGAPNMTSSTFGNTNSSNFATPTTTKSLFGSTSTLPFGNTKTTASGFVTSNTLSFGVPSTTSAPFGTNTPSFGAPTTSPVFATTNTSSFGGSTTTPAFGTTTTSSFSTPGTFNSPSFGVSLPFGSTQATTANTFNSNHTNLPFGNSAGTNSFNTFGTSNPPFNPVTTSTSFVSNNTFGNSSTTAAFGNNTASNAFGNTNAASPFGCGGSSNTFGNNNAVGSNTFGSGFGATPTKPEQSNLFPSQTSNMFGNNSAFGSVQSNNTPNAGASSNGVFTFGSPNTQSSISNGVFAFGAAEPSKAFNFGAPGTSGNGSGPSASSFSTVNAFGPPNSSIPSMFSIGSGSSTTQNRSRAVARAKRRT